MKLKLSIVRGVCGFAVYLGDYRIAGEKPWAGGTVLAEWTIKKGDLSEAIRFSEAIRRRKK